VIFLQQFLGNLEKNLEIICKKYENLCKSNEIIRGESAGDALDQNQNPLIRVCREGKVE